MTDIDLLVEKYETRTPSAQNAIDIFKEWTSAFPEDYGAKAGDLALFADPRIAWAVEQCGTLEGKSVLELGPLEGSHSYMLERHGAAEIVAIEAHRQAYLKCLVAKEILQLKRTRFLLGDFVKYLEETDLNFDTILASGVLYHMRDPIRLLELVAQKCQQLVLWTHYFDDTKMPKGDVRRKPFENKVTTVEHKGHSFSLRRRSYLKSWSDFKFCGGPEDTHYWMERDDIVSLCRELGFQTVHTAFDDPEHPGGPAALFYFAKDSA